MKKDEKPLFANYCGIPVIILAQYVTDYGTLALIQYEDGREEEIPLARVDFI
jgi:hypothetical protein